MSATSQSLHDKYNFLSEALNGCAVDNAESSSAQTTQDKASPLRDCPETLKNDIVYINKDELIVCL